MRAHETPRGWRKRKSVKTTCGSCKATDPYVFDNHHTRCRHCGHVAAGYGRSDFLNAAKGHGPWTLGDLIKRPSWMAEDEFSFRLGLCRTYLTRSFKSYLRDLEVFADMLGDAESPEEAAARADWRYRYSKVPGLVSVAPEDHSPAYPSLTVRVADGWWDGVPETGLTRLIPGAHKVSAQRRFGIPVGPSNQTHNGDWFLGWPPGWVKFTQPADEPKWWWVTVEPGRSLVYSAPIEHKRQLGYTEFFGYPELSVETLS